MKLEIFFDYLCEFCEIGHCLWSDLLPRFPWIEPVWRPCEAHPRAEEPHYGRHSDLAIQGMLFVREQGGDVPLYNQLLFSAVYQQGKNIEDTRFLADCARQAGVDAAAFEAALSSGLYRREQEDANRRAWDELALTAVPTYLLEDGRRLDSIPGVGVSRDRLWEFLRSTW